MSRLAMVPVGTQYQVCSGCMFVCPRRDYPEPTQDDLVAYLQTRPAVWLAVHRAMPPVLGPWQANDRSTPPVPETAQRVRYGSAAFAVVWDRGEAYTMRWGWQAGRVNGPGFTRVERGEAVTREGAELACDAAAIEAGVLLVDAPTARDLRVSDAFVDGLAPKEGA